jgi:hypothetical protein
MQQTMAQLTALTLQSVTEQYSDEIDELNDLVTEAQRDAEAGRVGEAENHMDEASRKFAKLKRLLTLGTALAGEDMGEELGESLVSGLIQALDVASREMETANAERGENIIQAAELFVANAQLLNLDLAEAKEMKQQILDFINKLARSAQSGEAYTDTQMQADRLSLQNISSGVAQYVERAGRQYATLFGNLSQSLQAQLSASGMQESVRERMQALQNEVNKALEKLTGTEAARLSAQELSALAQKYVDIARRMAGIVPAGEDERAQDAAGKAAELRGSGPESDRRAAQVGTPEWFGQQAQMALAAGNRELAGLANMMGNLEKAANEIGKQAAAFLPPQVYNGILGLITGNASGPQVTSAIRDLENSLDSKLGMGQERVVEKVTAGIQGIRDRIGALFAPVMPQQAPPAESRAVQQPPEVVPAQAPLSAAQRQPPQQATAPPQRPQQAPQPQQAEIPAEFAPAIQEVQRTATAAETALQRGDTKLALSLMGQAQAQMERVAGFIEKAAKLVGIGAPPALSSAVRTAASFMGTANEPRSQLIMKAADLVLQNGRAYAAPQNQGLLSSLVGFMQRLADPEQALDLEQEAQALTELERETQSAAFTNRRMEGSEITAQVQGPLGQIVNDPACREIKGQVEALMRDASALAMRIESDPASVSDDEVAALLRRIGQTRSMADALTQISRGGQRSEAGRLFAAALDLLSGGGSPRSFDFIMLAAAQLISNREAFSEQEREDMVAAAAEIAHGADESARSAGEGSLIGILAKRISSALAAIESRGRCGAAAVEIGSLRESADGFVLRPQDATPEAISRLFAAAGIAKTMDETLSRRGLEPDVKEGAGAIFARAIGTIAAGGSEEVARMQAGLAAMYVNAPAERKTEIENLSVLLAQDESVLPQIALYNQLDGGLRDARELRERRNLGEDALAALDIAITELESAMGRIIQGGTVAPPDLAESEESRLGAIISGPVAGESEGDSDRRDGQAAGLLALYSKSLGFAYDASGNFTAQLAALVSALVSQGSTREDALHMLAGISADAQEKQRLGALLDCAGAAGGVLGSTRLRDSARDEAGSLIFRSMQRFQDGNLEEGTFYQSASLLYAQTDNESDRSLIMLACDELTLGTIGMEMANQALLIQQARLEYRGQASDARMRTNMDAYFDLAALASRSGNPEEAGIVFQLATAYAMWAAADEEGLGPEAREQRASEMAAIEERFGDYGGMRELRSGARIIDIGTDRQGRLRAESIIAPMAAAILAGTSIAAALGGASPEENFTRLMELRTDAGVYALHSQAADFGRRADAALSSDERAQPRYEREQRREQELAQREREHGNEEMAGWHEAQAGFADRSLVERSVEEAKALFTQGQEEAATVIRLQTEAATAEAAGNSADAGRLRGQAETHRAESRRLLDLADQLLLGGAELDASITRVNTRHREDGRFELVIGLRTGLATAQGYLADALGQVVMEDGAAEGEVRVATAEETEAAKAAGAEEESVAGEVMAETAAGTGGTPIALTGEMRAQQAQVASGLINAGAQQVEAQRGTQRARDGLLSSARQGVHDENILIAADLNATMIGALGASDLDEANALIKALLEKGYEPQIGTEEYRVIYRAFHGSPENIGEAKEILRSLVVCVFAAQNVNDMDFFYKQLLRITGAAAESGRVEEREHATLFNVRENDAAYERIVGMAYSEDFNGAQRLMGQTLETMDHGAGIAYTSIRIANIRGAEEEWHAHVVQTDLELTNALQNALGEASIAGLSSEQTTDAQGEETQYRPEMLEAIIKHLPPEQQDAYLTRLYSIRDIVRGNEERRQLLAEIEAQAITDPATGRQRTIGEILQENNGLFYYNIGDFERGHEQVNADLDAGRLAAAESGLAGLEEASVLMAQVENRDIRAMSGTVAKWERMRQGGGYLIQDPGEGQRPADSYAIEGTGMIWQRYGGGALDEFEEEPPAEMTQGDKERLDARQAQIDLRVDHLSDSYGESAYENHVQAGLEYAARDALLSGDGEAAAAAGQQADAFGEELRGREAQRETGWQYARMNIEAAQHQLIMADTSEVGRSASSAITVYGFTPEDHARSAQQRLALADAVLETGNIVQAYDLLVMDTPIHMGDGEVGLSSGLLNCNMGEMLTLVAYTDGDIRGNLDIQAAYGRMAASATMSDLASLGIVSSIDLSGTYMGKQRPTFTISQWQPRNDEERSALQEIGRQAALMRGQVENVVFGHDSRWGEDDQRVFILAMGERMGFLGEAVEALGAHDIADARSQIQSSRPFEFRESDSQWVDTEPVTRDAIEGMKTWAGRYRIATAAGEFVLATGGVVLAPVTGGTSLSLTIGVSGLGAWRGLEMYHHERQWTFDSAFQFGMGIAGMVLAPAGMIAGGESSIFLGGKAMATISGEAELVAPTLLRGGVSFLGGAEGMVIAPKLLSGTINVLGTGMMVGGFAQFAYQAPSMWEAVQSGDMTWAEAAFQGFQAIVQPMAQYGFARWSMRQATRIGAPAPRSVGRQIAEAVFLGNPFDTAAVRTAARIGVQTNEALRAMPEEAQVSYGSFMGEHRIELPPERQAEVLTEYGRQYREAVGRGEPPISFERFAETSPSLYEARYQAYLERSGGIYDFRDLTSAERTYVESRNSGRSAEAAFSDANLAREGLPPIPAETAAQPASLPPSALAPEAETGAPAMPATQKERLRHRRESAERARVEQAQMQRHESSMRSERMGFTREMGGLVSQGEGGSQVIQSGEIEVTYSHEHFEAATELAFYAEQFVRSNPEERAALLESIPSDLRYQSQELSVDPRFIQATEAAHAAIQEPADSAAVQSARKTQLILSLGEAQGLPRFSGDQSVASSAYQTEALLLVEQSRGGLIGPEQLRLGAAERRRVADSIESSARSTIETTTRLLERERTPAQRMHIEAVREDSYAAIETARMIREGSAILEDEATRMGIARPAAELNAMDIARAANPGAVIGEAAIVEAILARAGSGERLPEYITGNEAVREGGIETFEMGEVLRTIEDMVTARAESGIESDIVIISADKRRLNQLNQLFGEENGDLALDAYREILRLTASRAGGDGSTYLIRPSARGDEVVVVIVADAGRGQQIRDAVTTELQRASDEVFTARMDPAAGMSISGLSGILASPRDIVSASAITSPPIEVRLQDGEVTATYRDDGSAFITRHLVHEDGTPYEVTEFLAPSTTRVDDPPFAADLGRRLGIEEQHDIQKGLEPVERERLARLWERRFDTLTQEQTDALTGIYLELGNAPQTEENIRIAIDAAARSRVSVDVGGGSGRAGETLERGGAAFEIRLEVPQEMLGYFRDELLPETGKGLSEVLTNSFGIRGLNTFLGHYRANRAISEVEAAVGAFASEHGITVRRLGTMKYFIEGGTPETVAQLHEAINRALAEAGISLAVSERPATALIEPGTSGSSVLAEVSNGHVVERRQDPARVRETDWDGQTRLYQNANALIGAMAIANDASLRALLGPEEYGRLAPVIDLVRQHPEIRNFEDLVFALREPSIGGTEGTNLEGLFRGFVVEGAPTLQGRLEAIAPRPHSAEGHEVQIARSPPEGARRRRRVGGEERLERMRRGTSPADDSGVEALPETESQPAVFLGGRYFERIPGGTWRDADSHSTVPAELARTLDAAAASERTPAGARQETGAQDWRVALEPGQLYQLARIGAYIDESGRIAFGHMDTAHTAADILFDASHEPGGQGAFPISLADQARLAESGLYFDQFNNLVKASINEARMALDSRISSQHIETVRLRSLADSGIIEVDGVQVKPPGGSEEAHIILDESGILRTEDLDELSIDGIVRMGRAPLARGGGGGRITEAQIEAFIVQCKEAIKKRQVFAGDRAEFSTEVFTRMRLRGYPIERLAHPDAETARVYEQIQREVARWILERRVARQAAPPPFQPGLQPEVARPAETGVQGSEIGAMTPEASPHAAETRHAPPPPPQRPADRALGRLVGREEAQELAALGITPLAEPNGALKLVFPEGDGRGVSIEMNYESPAGRTTLSVEFPEQAHGEPDYMYQHRVRQGIVDSVLAQREALLAANNPSSTAGARRLHLVALDAQAQRGTHLEFGQSNERAAAQQLIEDGGYQEAIGQGDLPAALAISERYAALAQAAEGTHPTTERGAYVDVVRGARQVIAIGDVHGDAYGLADQFLRGGVLIDTRPDLLPSDRSIPPAQRYRLNPDLPPGTQIVFTGDYIDRGPTSVEAVELVRQMQSDAGAIGSQVHALRGNHEALFLRFVDAYRSFDSRHVRGIVDGTISDTLSISCGWTRIGIRETFESIIRHYGSWEGFIAQNFDQAGGIRPGSFMEFISGTRAAVLIDNNYFTHGGPVFGTVENPIGSVQDLDSHFQKLFSTNDNAWADITQESQIKAMIAGDYSVAYVKGHGWGGMMDGPVGRQWMESLGIEHMYVGHEAQDGGVLRVGEHVTNMDVAMSESYGGGKGYVVIDPLQRSGFVRVEESRSAAPREFGIPEPGYAPLDFTNGRSRREALRNGLSDDADAVFSGRMPSGVESAGQAPGQPRLDSTAPEPGARAVQGRQLERPSASAERIAEYEGILDRGTARVGEVTFASVTYPRARFDEAIALIGDIRDVHSGAKKLADVAPVRREAVSRMLADPDYVRFIDAGSVRNELYLALSEASFIEEAARLYGMPSRPQDALDAFAYDFAYARARSAGREKPDAEDFAYAVLAKERLAGNEGAVKIIDRVGNVSRTEGGIEATIYAEDGAQYRVLVNADRARVISASADAIAGLAGPNPDADRALVDFLNAAIAEDLVSRFKEASGLIARGDAKTALKLLRGPAVDIARVDRFVAGEAPQDAIDTLITHAAQRELASRGALREDAGRARAVSAEVLDSATHEVWRIIEAARTGNLPPLDAKVYAIAEARAANQGRTEPSSDDFLFGVLLSDEAGPQFIEYVVDAMGGVAPAGRMKDVEGYAVTVLAIADRMRAPAEGIAADSWEVRQAETSIFRLAAQLHNRGVADPLTIFMNPDLSGNQKSAGVLDLFPLSANEDTFLMVSEAADHVETIVESVPEGPLGLARTVGKKAFRLEINGEIALRSVLDYAIEDTRRLPEQKGRMAYLDSFERALSSIADPAARMERLRGALGEILITDKGEAGPMRLTDRRTPLLVYALRGAPAESLQTYLGSRDAKRHIGRNVNFRAAVELARAINNAERTIQQMSVGRGPDIDANIRARKEWLETAATLLSKLPPGEADDVMRLVMPRLTDITRQLHDGRITPEQVSGICAELRNAGSVDDFVSAFAAWYNRTFTADLGLPDSFVAENSGLIVDFGGLRQNLARFRSDGDAFPGTNTGFAGNPKYASLNEFAAMDRAAAFDEVLPVIDATIKARAAGPEPFRDFKFSEEFHSELSQRYPTKLADGSVQGDSLFALWRDEGVVPDIEISGMGYAMTETGSFDELFYNARISGQDTCQNPSNNHFVVGALVGTVELPWIKEIVIRMPGNPEIVDRRILILVAGENGPILLVQPGYHRLGERNSKAMDEAMIQYLRQRYEPLGVEVRDITVSGLKTGTAANRGYETFGSGRSPLFYIDSNMYEFKAGPNPLGQNGLHTRTRGEPVRFPANWNGEIQLEGLFR